MLLVGMIPILVFLRALSSPFKPLSRQLTKLTMDRAPTPLRLWTTWMIQLPLPTQAITPPW